MYLLIRDTDEIHKWLMQVNNILHVQFGDKLLFAVNNNIISVVLITLKTFKY